MTKYTVYLKQDTTDESKAYRPLVTESGDIDALTKALVKAMRETTRLPSTYRGVVVEPAAIEAKAA